MSGSAKIKKGKIGALGKGGGSKETVIINLVKFYVGLKSGCCEVKRQVLAS